MEILTVDGAAPDPGVVARAVSLLLSGGLLIYPTETLYALGGRAADAEAVRRLRLAKGREGTKPLPVIAADLDQVLRLCAAWPEAAALLARTFWPGPLTLVLPAADSVSAAITAGSGSVAVRVPGLALARVLCARAGPLVSTSANLAGAPAPLTCRDAVDALGASADLALDAGPGQAQPSTLVDLGGKGPRLLREGGVRWQEVLAALREPGGSG